MTNSRAEPAGGRSRWPRGVPAAMRCVAFALVALGATPVMLAAAEGPIRLFPRATPSQPPAPDQPAPDAPSQAAPPAPTQPVASPIPMPQPLAPQGLRVEPLDAPTIDAIGLNRPGDRQFSQDLWDGSDGRLIRMLLAELPVVTDNPPLRELTRRLLITGAAPVGLTEPGQALAARLERLLAMGDLDDAQALAKQLPLSIQPELARPATEIALLVGDDETACARAAEAATRGNDAFWTKVTAYCQLVANDPSAAQLSLDLLRDEEHGDPPFYQLAGRIVGTSDAAPAQLGQPSALHVALLRLAELPVPAAVLETAPPAVLAAAVRDPGLFAEGTLELAERAFFAGNLPVETLAVIYAEAGADGGDALQRVETDWGPASRALAYRAVDSEPVASARAELLDATWRAASGQERFLIASIFAQPFAELPIERGLIWAAPSTARALLAADRPLPATRWFALLGSDGSTRAGSAVAGLVPLFALAGFGGSDAVPDFDADLMAAWRLAAAQEAGIQARAESLLALLEGVGAELPDDAWAQWLEPPLTARSVALPPAPIWRGLERAADQRRLGETVLYVAHLLQGDPRAAHPEALLASLRALRAVGLEQESRAIAVAAALSEDL